MSPPKKDTKKWKPKFPGAASDGEEDPYVKAQRFINVYRQLHVLREDLVTRYNDMLLEIDDDARASLPDIPGGRDVRDYLEYLERQKYGEDYESENDDGEELVSREEKAKAKTIADALASAQEKMNQSQLAVMQQAQEDARRNMELLAKTLSEARNDPARRQEAAELAETLKRARETLASSDSATEISSVQDKLRMQYLQAAQGQPVAVPVQGVPVQGGSIVVQGTGSSELGTKSIESLVEALTQAQLKSAETMAKTQSETMAKIFSQSQEMTARAMAEAFSKSQQSAAEVQGSMIAKAIAESQKHSNETLAALFSSIQKNGGFGQVAAQPAQIVIENNNAAAAVQSEAAIAAQAKAMAQAQVQAQKEILEMHGLHHQFYNV